MKRTAILLCVSICGCTSDSKPSAELQTTSATAPQSLPDSLILAGPMGQSIHRGRAILLATRDSLPRNVGSELRCSSCHLDAGMRKNGLMLAGVYGRYPQYRARTGGVVTLEARINDCFERSLNGRAIPMQSSEMTDLVSYMWFISRGIPVDGHIPGQGITKLSVATGDSLGGRAIFTANCVSCHGGNGEGTRVAPPLWGPKSFNIGAALARVQTSGPFIRHNMPFDRPGVLTDQQAMDVATYIATRVRPDFPGKENDWPKGGAPPDVPYALKSARPIGPSVSGMSSPCPTTGLWAVCSIEKRIKQSGFVALPIAGETRARDGFSIRPVAYNLGKSRLELYVYEDRVSAARDVGGLDTVRVMRRGAPAGAEPAPVFIRSENLVALLYTDDATQAERLFLAITAGAPQSASR